MDETGDLPETDLPPEDVVSCSHRGVSEEVRELLESTWADKSRASARRADRGTGRRVGRHDRIARCHRNISATDTGLDMRPA